MPEMNGIEMITKIKQDPKTSSIPIVMHSGFCMKTDFEYLTLYNIKCLPKPSSRIEIINAIQSAIKQMNET